MELLTIFLIFQFIVIVVLVLLAIDQTNVNTKMMEYIFKLNYEIAILKEYEEV